MPVGGPGRSVQPFSLARSPRNRSIEWIGDRLIEELPVAGALARVIAGAAVGARQRVLFHVFPPGLLVVAGLRQSQPCLDVLAGRTGVVAGRKMIDVDGALPSPRAGAFADGFLIDGCQILRSEAQAASSWLSWEPREQADGQNVNGLPSGLSPFLLARPRHGES